MTHPLATLMELNSVSCDLDMVQSWINGARVASAANQDVQLELDRQQLAIDQKRVFLELRMLDISSRN
jgi:hypothetical protein